MRHKAARAHVRGKKDRGGGRLMASRGHEGERERESVCVRARRKKDTMQIAMETAAEPPR